MRRYPRDRSCPTVRGYLPLLAVQASAKAWNRIVEGTERSNRYYIQRENDVQGFDFKTET